MDDINILSAINKLNKCWRDISRTTIKNCFIKNGFKRDNSLSDEIVEIDDDVEKEKQLFKNLNPMVTKYDFNFDVYQYIAVD